MEDEQVYTPESLAWDLLFDDSVDIKPLMAFCEDSEGVDKTESLFQILATIYFEMVFSWYKVQYMVDNVLESEDDFKLDVSKINLELMKFPFADKFVRLNFQLIVHEIGQQSYIESKQDRYCTVIFKDSETDEMYFKLNSQNIPEDKRYHFIRNVVFKRKDKINDIYMTFPLNKSYYKIAFNEIRRLN